LSARQLRLIAWACCRWLDRKGHHAAVINLAERFADGHASAHELAAARFAGRFRTGDPAWAICWAEGDALSMTRRALGWVEGISRESVHAVTGPLGFLTDVAGDGPLSGKIEAAWLAWGDAVVPKLARVIYDEKAFERMPILADALEDAGCSVPELMAHCRGSGPHVRGCWAIDLLAGMAVRK
jgi:hypothetical protein